VKKSKRKPKAKVKVTRVVKLAPDKHLLELHVEGAEPPEKFDEPILSTPKKHWYDWLVGL
jgi:hypothetical protein